jgi:hypothetical protein
MEQGGVGRTEPFGLAAARAAARHLVDPSEQPVRVRVGRTGHDARAADDHLPAGPVDGDQHALRYGPPTSPHGTVVDHEAGGPYDGRLAHRLRDHGGVAGRPATGGDHARGGPASANPRKTTFPVMLATNTCPSTR